VVPDFFALQFEVLVLARRLATPYVVGPARPATGLIPYRDWNFLIAAQSLADCLPSTETDPKPPSFLRYPSTCFWYLPVEHEAAAAFVTTTAATGVRTAAPAAAGVSATIRPAPTDAATNAAPSRTDIRWILNFILPRNACGHRNTGTPRCRSGERPWRDTGRTECAVAQSHRQTGHFIPSG
jgi:hypothetical protein